MVLILNYFVDLEDEVEKSLQDYGVSYKLEEVKSWYNGYRFGNSNGNNLSPDDLWELLLFSGYLTVKEKIDMNTYFVRIPNSEIMTFFKNLFVDIIFNGLGTISKLI